MLAITEPNIKWNKMNKMMKHDQNNWLKRTLGDALRYFYDLFIKMSVFLDIYDLKISEQEWSCKY